VGRADRPLGYEPRASGNFLGRTRVSRLASCPSVSRPGTARCLPLGPVAPAQKRERSRAGKTYQEREKESKKART